MVATNLEKPGILRTWKTRKILKILLENALNAAKFPIFCRDNPWKSIITAMEKSGKLTVFLFSYFVATLIN